MARSFDDWYAEQPSLRGGTAAIDRIPDPLHSELVALIQRGVGPTPLRRWLDAEHDITMTVGEINHAIAKYRRRGQ